MTDRASDFDVTTGNGCKGVVDESFPGPVEFFDVSDAEVHGVRRRIDDGEDVDDGIVSIGDIYPALECVGGSAAAVGGDEDRADRVGVVVG